MSSPQHPHTVPAHVNIAVGCCVVLAGILVWAVSVVLQKKSHVRPYNKVVELLLISLLGFSLMYLFVKMMKNVAGEPRPYFLAACQPDETLVEELIAQGTTWVNKTLSSIICTQTDSLRYRRSFPSGHAAESVYPALLYIFITSTLHYTSLSARALTGLTQFTVFGYSVWVSATRVLDEHHFWWDVLAGGVVGVVFSTATFYLYLRHVISRREENSYQNANCKLVGSDSTIITFESDEPLK